MSLFAEAWEWEALGKGVVAAGLFGILGIVLLAVGFKVFDWMWPKLDVEKELADNNLAVAIVVGAVLIAIGLIVHASVHG
jgi:putative membrane protein